MKKRVLTVIAVLTLLTAALAVIHLTTRTPEVEGAVIVNGKTVMIDSLSLSSVKGTVVNGKGEKIAIDAQGIALTEVCGLDFSTATVTASDEYRAEISASESQNAYLILRDDNSLQLIVFGVENLKRCVKNVVRIDAE